MIKVGNEYLEYDGMPDVVKQVKTADTIDSAGDFSYSFSLPMTGNNMRILRIGINRADSLINYRIPCIIEDNGTQLYTGYLRIEAVRSTIDVSFFAGNSEWFAELVGKFIYNLDLSRFKLPLVNIDPNPVIPASWDNTEGLTYPLMDSGQLRDWSVSRVGGWAFHPMMYVKNVMDAIFQQSGYKLDGELLNESRYINAVAGADIGIDITPSISRSRSAFVGKGGTQSINTTYQLVTFTDTSYPYYVGDQGNFAGSRYTADEDITLRHKIRLTFDASVDYQIQLRLNGSPIDTISGTGSSVSAGFNDGGTPISADDGDYFEIFMSVDSGTVNILSGDWTIKLIRFDATYPQFLFADMTQSDFVRSIFYMFNVTASFDPYTKTVTANLFKNVDKLQQDLSEYIDSVELDFIETIDEFSKNNIFQYEPAEDADIQSYNEGELVPYGGGNLSPVNEFLTGDNNVSVQFASSYSYYNDRFQANLMSLGTAEFTNDSEPFEIISVADNGSGTAEFETAEPHGLSQQDYVRITSTSTGQYLGLGFVNSVDSDVLFTIQYLPFQSFGSSGFTGTGYRVTGSSNYSGKVFIMINIPNMLVSDFSFNTTINYGGTLYTRVAYAYFVKSDLGLPIDNYREVLAFQNPVENGLTGVTLFDSYYNNTIRYLNDPVKLKGRFLLPHKVFNNLDLTKSIRVKTPEFNVLAFSSKLTGHNPCEIELIKL